MDGTCSHTCTDDNVAERGCVHTVSVGAVGFNAGGSRLEALDGIQSNHFSGFNPPTEVEPLCLCVCGCVDEYANCCILKSKMETWHQLGNNHHVKLQTSKSAALLEGAQARILLPFDRVWT